MIVNVYSIRDDVAETFCEPMTAANDNIAKRLFDNSLANISDDNLWLKKDELTLYRIGRYDTEKGYIEGESPTIIKKGVKNNADTV